MSESVTQTAEQHAQPKSSGKLLIAAVGVVYGDIGTSPLYTLREVFNYGVQPNHDGVLGVLSLHASTQPLNALRDGVAGSVKSWVLLNGPEGGLTDAEDAAARAKGFAALSLGERVLRAETAALGALALLTLE